jgi:hypothetical protein
MDPSDCVVRAQLESLYRVPRVSRIPEISKSLSISQAKITRILQQMSGDGWDEWKRTNQKQRNVWSKSFSKTKKIVRKKFRTTRTVSTRTAEPQPEDSYATQFEQVCRDPTFRSGLAILITEIVDQAIRPASLTPAPLLLQE